jgi:hypothetical protein
MTQAVQTAQYGSSSVGLSFKNRIINGAMVIDQRNAGASVTVNGAVPYTLDRWQAWDTTDGAFTVQQIAVTNLSGFVNALKVTITTADASVDAGQVASVSQNIEGYNTADLNWGSASAKPITISFWVQSSLTGTFGGAVENSGTNRSYPFTYSISSANTWEYKTITIAGDTSGTWLKTNGIGIRVWFDQGTGTTYTGTAGAWAGADYRNATGAVSVIGTLNATWQITGVQLEVGSTATSFDYLDYGRSLIQCQRYYYQSNSSVNGSYSVYPGYSLVGNIFGQTFFHRVEMRATPTVSVSGSFTVANADQPSFLPFSTDSMLVYSTARTTAGNSYFAGGATVSVSAEL